MKPSQVKTALHHTIKAGTPAFIWGSPGIGKSDITRQLAAEENLELRDIRASLLDPVDLRGLPRIDSEDRMSFCPPVFLPTTGRGILFLDELNQAAPATLAACYQLILDRRLGEYSLPDGWSIIAAGNRETDRAIVNRMPTPLANRFVHIYMEPDLEDWISWGLGAGIRTELLAYARYRPAVLNGFDPARTEKAFSTPRSLEKLSRIMDTNPPAGLELELYSGIVGQGTATEILGFRRIFMDLPDLDQIEKHPDTATAPTDPAILYALAGALSHRATVRNIAAITTYLDRIPAEFSVLTMRDATRIHPEIMKTAAFIAWATKNQDIIL